MPLEIAKVLADSLIKLGGPESLDGKAVLAGIRRISKSYKDAYRILIHTGSRTNENGESIEGNDEMYANIDCCFLIILYHHGKNGVKWDINYNFSEKTIITVAAKTVLREDVIGKA